MYLTSYTDRNDNNSKATKWLLQASTKRKNNKRLDVPIMPAVTWFESVFLCVFRHDISKTDAARITKLDTEMFHDEFW